MSPIGDSDRFCRVTQDSLDRVLCPKLGVRAVAFIRTHQIQERLTIEYLIDHYGGYRPLFSIDYSPHGGFNELRPPNHRIHKTIVEDAIRVNELLKMPLEKIPLVMNSKKYQKMDILIKEILNGSFSKTKEDLRKDPTSYGVGYI